MRRDGWKHLMRQNNYFLELHKMKMFVIFHARRDGWKSLMMKKNGLSDRFLILYVFPMVKKLTADS
ncbi:MAG: hypothetical protein F6K24_32005 [Okeania sp. SIO2D1]|nr:hypothetical protein [Okeania sp. SIO2D1]